MKTHQYKLIQRKELLLHLHKKDKNCKEVNHNTNIIFKINN